MLIRISPDGSVVTHVYNDFLHKITKKHSDLQIERATDVFYKDGHWRIKILATGVVLPDKFDDKGEAVEFEIKYLEDLIKKNEYN